VQLMQPDVMLSAGGYGSVGAALQASDLARHSLAVLKESPSHVQLMQPDVMLSALGYGVAGAAMYTRDFSHACLVVPDAGAAAAAVAGDARSCGFLLHPRQLLADVWGLLDEVVQECLAGAWERAIGERGSDAVAQGYHSLREGLTSLLDSKAEREHGMERREHVRRALRRMGHTHVESEAAAAVSTYQELSQVAHHWRRARMADLSEHIARVCAMIRRWHFR
jgi:hypothetical protein